MVPVSFAPVCPLVMFVAGGEQLCPTEPFVTAAAYHLLVPTMGEEMSADATHWQQIELPGLFAIARSVGFAE